MSGWKWIGGVPYEVTGPRPPEISKSSFSDADDWVDGGSGVEVRLATRTFDGGYRVKLEVSDARTVWAVPMAEISALYFPESGEASLHVDVAGGRGRGRRFDRRGVSMDGFLGTVNDVVSGVVSGIDFDDLGETRAFVRGRLVRAVTSVLAAAGFDGRDL